MWPGLEREFQIGEFKAYSGSFDDATVEELKAMPEVSHYWMRRSAWLTIS
jgi:hypothetical protein